MIVGASELQTGRWKQGIFSKTVKDLQAEKNTLSTNTYASVIRSCTVKRNLSDGRQIHHLISSSKPNRYLANLLIDMYGKCGSIDEARAVFDSIPNPNVFSWNMILSAYAHTGHMESARRMFDVMPEKDAASFTCMIAAYGRCNQIREARIVFDWMSNPGVVPWNAIISVYAHAGHALEAVLMFRKMDLEGIIPNEITFVTALDACGSCGALAVGRAIHIRINRELLLQGEKMDVVLATALVSMYGKCGELAEAREVFESVEPYRRNVVCWTSMLAAHAACGDLDESTRLFEAMPVRNSVSWNAMISACVRNGQFSRGLILFKKMDVEGIGLDEVSFLSALEACAGLPAVMQGRLLHAELTMTKLLDDVRVSTALLDFYAKCGLLREAKRVLEKGPRNAVSWNAMVSAYANSGHGAEAVKTLRRMELEGFLPDEATFVAVLSACSRSGLLDDGLTYFVRAKHDFGLVATRDHYVCLVDLLGRASWLEEAEELLRRMPYEAHSVAWMTLLICSKLQSDVPRAARAAAKAWDLEPENAAPYVLLNTAS